jgi:hypothetical protein
MKDLSDLLREVFAYTEKLHPFNKEEVAALIDAIYDIKVIDPACGSGAFPMGILHKLVFILGKLDPNNELWKTKQLAKAAEIPDSTIREKAITDIEETFERNESDYSRKLYLIANCIYGVDIQPIAVQIAKLRFFISLVVDQKIDDSRENRGVLPLPNLETKFVAANTLIGLDRPQQLPLRNPLIAQKEKELETIRQRHFAARTQRTKQRCREEDSRLRAEIGDLLEHDGLPHSTTERLVRWDPYDQNASADFFDPEWMFGITRGFDVVIANPPYGANLTDYEMTYLDNKHDKFKSAVKNSAIYFSYKAQELLNTQGIHTYIVPKSICYSKGWNKCAAFVSNGLMKLIDSGKAFEQVLLEQVMYTRTPSHNTPTYRNGIYDGEVVQEFTDVDKQIFHNYYVLLTGQTPPEMQLIKRLISNLTSKWDRYVSIERGLNWQSRATREPKGVPIQRGAQLSPYHLAPATDYVVLSDFDRSEYEYQLKPKILNQLAPAHVMNPYPHFYLQAALDMENRLVFETISCTFLKDSSVDLKRHYRGFYPGWYCCWHHGTGNKPQEAE